MTSRLLVSVSGIRDLTLDPVRNLVGQLEGMGVPVSLLVAPHIGEDWHLARDPETLDWLRLRAEYGDAIMLGGFDQTATGRRAEFASLGTHEARLRLTAAARQLDGLGLASSLFAPPRWLLSPGTLAVLPELGFEVAGDVHGIHLLTSGRLLRARVLAFGEGFGTAAWWRRNVVAAARRNATAGRLVRLSVSGAHLGHPKVRQDLVAAVSAVLESGAEGIDYRSL